MLLPGKVSVALRLAQIGFLTVRSFSFCRLKVNVYLSRDKSIFQCSQSGHWNISVRAVNWPGTILRMTSPTSWPLLGLHTSAIKGKKCAFFALDIISAIFFYLLKVWSTWIVHWLYLPLPCSCNLSSFQWKCLSLEAGPCSVLCAEMILIYA